LSYFGGRILGSGLTSTLRYIGISILILLLQSTIVPFTSIGNIIPDIIVVWIVYLSIKLGQIPATIAGFTIGLMQDIIGGQFLGLGALSKTVAGFLAGYFYNENKIDQILGSYEFLVITAISAFAHNVIYFIILVQGSEIGVSTAVFGFGIYSTLYTLAIALLPLFLYSRKIST
jgi:rod shape-determining protein MreD